MSKKIEIESHLVLSAARHFHHLSQFVGDKDAKGLLQELSDKLSKSVTDQVDGKELDQTIEEATYYG